MSDILKQTGYFVVLASEENSNSKLCEESGEEDEYYEYCTRETDFCKDSSDSSYDDSTFDVVEYEVGSTTETESQYGGSSSGTDEHFDRIDITTIICGTSTEFADTSDSYDSQDSELSPADFWRCIKCNNQQNNPLFRYCEKCYQIKKTHFPPPPRMKKRRHHRALGAPRRYHGSGPNGTSSSLLSNGNNCINISFSHNLELRKPNINDNFITRKDFFTNEDEVVRQVRKRKKNVVGGFSKRARTNSYSECSEIDLSPVITKSNSVIARSEEEKEDDTVSLADTVIGELSDGEINALNEEIVSDFFEIPPKKFKRDPNALIQSFSCIETTTIGDSSNNALPIMKKCSTVSSDSSSSSSGSCIFCLTEPKNAVFVHSKFVHLCSCYKCAVKIFNKNKRCPICNCAVKTVLQVFAH